MALRVFGVHNVIEVAPLLYAVDKMSGGTQRVEHGGVPHLIGKGHLLQAAAGVPGAIIREQLLPENSGGADVATNAETQALRMSLERPDIRIILQVAEGLYRIVGRRSAGISSVRDLAGKRVGTFPRTSAAFYLFKELEHAGLAESDVQMVNMAPAMELSKAMIAGDLDAIAIWEPASQQALDHFGSDAIVLQTPGLYVERFNLNTTADKLANPETRREIVALVRALIDACKHITEHPEDVWPLSHRTNGYDMDLLKACWPHHRWVATMTPGVLLDVLEDEERWIAATEGDGRAPRSRDELATLIDDSVYREAVGA